MTNDLQDKTVLVTGANRGIGRAIVASAIQRGAKKVYAAVRRLDPDLADRTYLEPLTAEFLEEIIKRERPDAILPTLGGQTGLNLVFELSKAGVLEKYDVELIGASEEAITRNIETLFSLLKRT